MSKKSRIIFFSGALLLIYSFLICLRKIMVVFHQNYCPYFCYSVLQISWMKYVIAKKMRMQTLLRKAGNGLFYNSAKFDIQSNPDFRETSVSSVARPGRFWHVLVERKSDWSEPTRYPNLVVFQILPKPLKNRGKMAFLCKINQKNFFKIFPLVKNAWSHFNISWSFWNFSKILVGKLVVFGNFLPGR